MVHMTRWAPFAVALMLVAPIALRAQQPRIYRPVIFDGRSPEEKTLAERVAHLDAALAIKVVGEPRGVAVAMPAELFGPLANRPDFDPPPILHTETLVEILEVFKGSAAAGVGGTRAVVTTSGGDAPWKDGRVIGNDGPPPLVVGETYIVMVSGTRPDIPVYADSYDIFHLAGGRLVAHGGAPTRWPFAKKILNRPWRDALAAFRAAAIDAESLN